MELVFVQLKLAGNGLIDGFDLGGMNAGVLLDAVVVEVEDLSVNSNYVSADFGKISFSSFRKS